MRAYSYAHLSDHDLLRGLAAHVGQDCERVATLLAYLAEVDARRLYAPAGYPSMFAFCIGELPFSEDSAYRRIQAARTARRFPILFPALAAGRLHLTAVILMAPYLNAANVEELIGLATRKTRAEIEGLLARRFPRTELLTMVEALPASSTDGQLAPARVEVHGGESVDELAPEPTGAGDEGTGDQLAPARVGSRAPSTVAPLSSESFALHLTIDRSTHEMLRYAEELLSHAVPSGDLSQVLRRVLQAAIPRLEKRKFAGTNQPRPGHRRRSSSNPRHIPAHVRRAVWKRDGGRCTFVGESGHRCESKKLLEFDHVDPVARGGQATIDGIRLRCRAHNRLEADRAFGAGFMDEKRSAARRAVADSRARRAKPRAEAVVAADEQARDLVACLRELGFRARQARRATEFCATLPVTTLEEKVRAALKFLCPKPRFHGRVGSSPAVPA